jgi:hypothetical protein
VKLKQLAYHLSVVKSTVCMRNVFNNFDVMPLCDCADLVHSYALHGTIRCMSPTNESAAATSQ